VELAKTLVVGVGEVGGPLATILESAGPVLRLDIQPQEIAAQIGVMHLCFPFRDRDQFVRTAVEYIERFHPRLTIINSTVLPGTTRRVAEATGTRVAFSPVRGKHARMVEDLKRYIKFIAADDPAVAAEVQDHFKAAGLCVARMDRSETLELAKLAETTYFGLLIAYAQELNRFAAAVGADYAQATAFFDEISFLPRVRYTPGFIGGHCVIPNLKLLEMVGRAPLFEAILDSNERRGPELEREAKLAGQANR
jgi:UDP-N-acetyl-D-mannosaminuronate dehydrogenase